MRLPSQSLPVARHTTAARDLSAGLQPSDCCGPGKCCVGACLFGNCVGACIPNIGQC
ncbi:hypothetical protein [Ancylobacter radicis]|uniref:Uncharacterized protein n=1 Tax=Ancylobacter radicis TaxID=2836179 RepID=A0ABS5R1T4_9HYPH|nr:hypothetical protein [Ancylobacter radicis]MBS9475624.1 hypothetical protein [Ancylobacter radicis]